METNRPVKVFFFVISYIVFTRYNLFYSENKISHCTLQSISVRKTKMCWDGCSHHQACRKRWRSYQRDYRNITAPSPHSIFKSPGTWWALASWVQRSFIRYAYHGKNCIQAWQFHFNLKHLFIIHNNMEEYRFPMHGRQSILQIIYFLLVTY